MQRYHKILTHVKKKLGSIIFLENLLSLHNVTFVINKVPSVKRSLEKVSFFLPLFQQHSSTKSLLPALQWSASNGQNHTFNWGWSFPTFSFGPKPPWDRQGVNKWPAISELLSAGPRASGSCCQWCSARAAPGKCQGTGMQVLPAWPALDWPLVVVGNRSFVSEHTVLLYPFLKLIILLM